MADGSGGGEGGGGGSRRRIAAIDIGSNAMRLTVVKVRRDGTLRRLHYHRAAVRLGASSFRSGRLTAEDLERGVAAMRDFRRRMELHEVGLWRAVATSAVREASNGAELVDRARREAGLDIEVIDGEEEARLVWVAVRELPEIRGRWLLVDLGGGSLEVSVVHEGGLERSATYPLGTLRLLDRIEAEGSAGGSAEGSAEDAVDRALARVEAGLEAELQAAVGPTAPGQLAGLMATGGNIEALAELAGAEPDGAGVSRVSLEALSRTMAEVEALSYERRMSELGLRPDRADVIVPAGRVYRRVAELAGVREIVVPNVGVADGILRELARA